MAILANFSDKHWGYIKGISAALRAWHFAHGHWEFDSLRENKQFVLFWQGLKKSASHKNNASKPISIEELEKFIDERLRKRTTAGLRDAAWACFAFYGIRRISECINVKMEDITLHENSLACFIGKQKNDQVGKGMTCYISPQENVKHDPVKIICRYVHHLKENYSALGLSKSSPLFINTKGKKAGQKCTDYVFRKALHEVFFDNSNPTKCIFSPHSLRKGGTSWYIKNGILPKHIQEQGGWKSFSTMENIYIAELDNERHSALSNVHSHSSLNPHSSLRKQ